MVPNQPKTAVHVTIAALKGKEMIGENGTYSINGTKIEIGIAVFCGSVLSVKVIKYTVNYIKKYSKEKKFIFGIKFCSKLRH